MPSDTTATVSFSVEELELLRGLVSDALAGLREEIYKTENYELRQEFKQREVLLNDIARRLRA